MRPAMHQKLLQTPPPFLLILVVLVERDLPQRTFHNHALVRAKQKRKLNRPCQGWGKLDDGFTPSVDTLWDAVHLI